MNNRSLLKFRAGKIGITFLLLSLFCCDALLAQTNNPAASYPANRFLLVVETSSEMQRRASPALQAVQGILGSSIPSQARRGDSLGVWTFNADLSVGVFPLQQFAPEAQKAISERVLNFVKSQRLEKPAKLEKLLTALDRLAKNSPFLTVIIVCTGDQDFHGTPFDQPINDFLRTWHSKKQDAGSPFVFALRAQGGKFVDFSMTPSPWTVELPSLPNELFVPIPPPQPVATAKPATSSVPPLIISGKKRQPAQSLNGTETNAQQPQASVAATTNSPPKADQINAPVAQAIQQPIATPVAPSQLRIVTDPPVTSPPPVTDTPAPTPVTRPAGNIETPAAPRTTPSPGEALAKNSGADIPSNQKMPTVLPAPGREATSPGALVTNVQPQSERNMSAKRSSPSPATQVAVVPQPSNNLHRILLWGTGFLALVAIIAGVWIWRRNSRPANETSVITEWYDRDKH